MSQLALFEPPDTVPSPVCVYDHCARKGRAVLGPVQAVGEWCTTRTITCLTCGRTGVQSTNTEPKVPA